MWVKLIVITVSVLIIELWKEPPSNNLKKVRTMEDERVKQLIALDSEETITTGEAVQEDEV